MENKKKLSRWLLDNYKELGLKATQGTWIKEWLPGFYDFGVSIAIDGNTHTGRGIDRDSDLAFTKAGAEALERAICFENKISTCGVAVHTNFEQAKLNAKNELIERDRFFCHYLTQTPFKEISPKISGIDVPRIKEKLESHSVVIKAFEMGRLNNVRSVAWVSYGEKTGLVLGLGASENEEEAIQKALLECLMNTIAALFKRVRPLNLDEFKNQSFIPSEFHRRLYLGDKSLAKSNGWLLEGSHNEKPPEFIDPELFEYQKLMTENELLNECLLFAIQCKNPTLQKSFYGNFNPENINTKRVQEFSGKIKKISDLNSLPHPLG